MRQKRALAVVVLLFSLIVFALSGISVSWLEPPYYSEQRTCSETWDVSSCGFGGLESDFDDSFDLAGTCNGSQVGGIGRQHVKDIYLNQTYALFGQTLSVTCEFYQYWWTNSYRDEQYVFYYNGSAWVKIAEWHAESYECGAQGYCFFSKTATFTVNASEGMQVVRCILDYEGSPDTCADENPPKAYFYYDNDDVNFTAVKPLLNTTSFELSVSDGSNVHRSQNLTAHVQWNKVINESQIVHTGRVISAEDVPLPYTGNWTNYTLVLSNTTEFNHTGAITVAWINAADNYNQWNQLNDNKYFYLWSSANITSAELSRNITYNMNNTVNFSCTVFDNYTGLPVVGYNVDFFRNGIFFDDEITDSTGMAEIESGTGSATPHENWTYTCNITNMPSLFYNSSFEQSAILQIVDLGVSIYPIAGAAMGSNITLTANITGNATLIEGVYGEVAYYNATAGHNEYEEVIMYPVNTYSHTNTEYAGNYTTKLPGEHNATVNASAEQLGSDSQRTAWDMISFSVGGGANVTNISLSEGTIYNGTSTKISCRVANNESDAPIFGYSVSFFNSTSYLGSGNTNSTGWANITYIDSTQSPPKAETLKCNITAQLGYNVTYPERSAALQIINLGVSIAPIENTGFGSSVTITANITGNATQITEAKANISYYNYTLGQYGWEEVSLSAINTHSYINTEYFANYTPKTAGVHNVTVEAQAEIHPEELEPRVARNTTYFEIGGWANITNISLSDNIIYNGTSTLMFCRVANNYSAEPINDYNVSFFNSTHYLGMGQTNSTGWANITYNDFTETPPAIETLKCNITGMPELFYNASSEMNTTLDIVDLHVNLEPIANADFGDNITVSFNVTGNASLIDPVVASVRYYNYSLNDYTSDIVALTSIITHSPTNTGYSGIYAVVQSGSHEAMVVVNADRTAENTTVFNVSYGTPSVSFTFPNFRVLANQSFNLNVTVTASGGDIVNPVLILNFTNDSMMNISAVETYTKNIIANITNGSYAQVSWNSTTNEVGLLRASINATTNDSTSLEYDTPYSVLLPITSVSLSETNITGIETFTVKIVGNTTNIMAANFTAEKPYSGGNEFFSGALIAVEEETTCVGIGAETGNVAIGANTSCSGGTCALAVDNNTYTAWLQNTQYKWIVINLSQPYTIDAIEIVWSGTETNTSIYYKRNYGVESGNIIWRPFNEFMYQDAPTNQNTTFAKAQTPFTTDTILINDSSSAPSGIQIYEVRIYPVLGSVDKCYIYEANYTSLNYSGTHLVSSNVTTQGNTGDISSNSSFFVEFGTPVITKATFEEYPKVSTSYLYGFDVYAEGGDLRDINATLSTFNGTIINFTTGENISQNISFIARSNTKSVSWNLTAGSLGDETTNISVFANSSSGLGGTGYKDANVTVIFADSEAPVIHWFSISQNKTNLHQSIMVTVNVSDNIQVRNVTAEVTAPEFSFNTTNSTDWKAEGLWTILINSDSINQTGNYSVKVHATDVGNNLSSSQNNTNFTTYDTYTISLSTNYSTYNRGENITFAIDDVNNNTVSGATWIVNETFANNTTTIFSGLADEYLYNFSSNKTSGAYTLNVFVNKSGNTGNYTNKSVSASASLELSFTYPSSASTFQKNTPFDPQPKLLVKNIRGEILDDLTNVSFSCPNAAELSLSYIADRNYTRSGSPLCASSASAGVSFYLSASASDTYNNTGTASLQLYTQADAALPPPPPGGGGGGGVSVETIVINETQNATIYIPPKIQAFNFSISISQIDVMQGKKETVIASVANTGDFDLTVQVRNSDTHLFIEYAEEFFLKKGEEIDIPIKIYANLSSPPAEEIVTMYLSGGGIGKNKMLKVTVLENPDLFTLSATLLEVALLEEKIAEYVAAGIDASGIQSKIDSAILHIALAEQAYLSGDADALSEAVASAQKEVTSVKNSIGFYDAKMFVEQNKYVLFGILIGLNVLLYFASIFLMPYMSLSRKLYALRRKEKILIDARKTSETQYFTRKINEATFQRIMTGDQDKIYNIRSEAKRIEEELSLMRRFKLNEIQKIKDDWKIRAREVEKAKAIEGIKRGTLTEREVQAFDRKKPNIFRRIQQKILSIFKRN